MRKTCGFTMDGEQTDYIWGVVDMVPDESTDFPDTRCKTAIHSHNGSCMIIPREGDKIRLYIQLTDTDAVDPVTGRIDLKRYGPERLMEVRKLCRRVDGSAGLTVPVPGCEEVLPPVHD